VEGRRRAIDIGTVNGIRFATVAAAGFDAEVGRRTRAGLWRHGGRVGYMAAVVATVFGYRAGTFHLRGDFGTRDKRLLLCAVSNTGLYGGGIRIAPGSSPDDGVLDCCLVDPASPWRLLRLFPRTYQGGHVGQPEVEMLRTATLQMDTDRATPLIADGEPAGTTPAEFGVERGALEVIVGRTDARTHGRRTQTDRPRGSDMRNARPPSGHSSA
jgi:diacylglycerol kinase (ATP)